MTRCAVFAVLIVVAFVAQAESPWRVYAGGTTTAWRTTGGHHGHDVDCPPEQQHDRCERSDLGRANLDNSIGFRLGAERRREWTSALTLVYGAELNIDSTEYNISQRDIYIGSGVVTAGAVTDFFYATWGLRGGAGLTATDDGHAGGVILGEASVELPFTQAVRFRLAHRESAFTLDGLSLRSADTSFLLVFTETGAVSPWRLSAGVGISSPGSLFGESLELSRAPFWRFTASRGVTDRTSVGVSYISAAHESKRKSVFLGYPDNERGKTINGLGVDWIFELAATPRYFVELSAGVEAADWSDDHQLLQSADRTISGGFEIAPALKLSVGLPLTENLALVVSTDQLYWTGIDLGESRLAVSLSSR
ncbi:MAG: hypothetical protein M3P06_07835 [Acidobacteriota bacterium]|nr:hypothetical protein [Acidobacteriota bacterium]